MTETTSCARLHRSGLFRGALAAAPYDHLQNGRRELQPVRLGAEASVYIIVLRRQHE